MAGFNKLGASAGVLVDYAATDNSISGITGELRYTSKGSRRLRNVENPQSGAWDLLSLHYIELPFYYHINVVDKAHLQLGLVGSYLFGSYYEDKQGASNRGDLRPYELGILIGGSYPLTDHLFFSLQFENSLHTINTSAVGSGIVPRDGLFNYLAIFSLGYLFNEER